MNRNRIKRIYIFEYAGRYKIGMTNCIERRLAQLSCGCPGIKCMYESDLLDNASLIERYIHNTMASYCVGGEWFECDFDVLLNIILSAIEKSGRKITSEQYKSVCKKENVIVSDAVPKMLDKLVGMFLDDAQKEIEEKKEENRQIEGFAKSIEGIDCPNVYSDLIYKKVFGTNMEELRGKYSPGKYESFRKYLPSDKMQTIENLERVIGSLINLGWNYSEIEKFVFERL